MDRAPKRDSRPHKVYAYLRVSSSPQDLESQKLGIKQYVRQNKLGRTTYIEDVVSSRQPLEKRKISALLEKLRKDDVLVVAEISRLGRNMVEILTLLEQFINKGIRVFSIKEGYELDDSLNSRILTLVLGMAAEINRQLTSQRVREGQARTGKKIGRPKGRTGPCKLDPHEKQIRELARKGVSKAAISRIYDCSWATVDTFAKRHGIRVEY